MQFLAPLFLAGLAAIAVPLWFHLIRKEQATRIPFSSLRYVPPKEMEMVRRQRLRHWPLFLLRLLLVVLLALALARPYWRNFGGGWSSGALARVVLLDNSFSMRADGRWSAAQDAAIREIESAPPGTELTVALVSDRVDVVSEPDESPAALQAKVRRSEPGYRATRLDQGIQFGGDLLKQSRMGTREIVMVSDFQKNGLHLSSWTMPEGVGLRTVDVQGAAANVFIEDVQMPADFVGTGQRGELTLRVRNTGPADIREARVQLKSDDQVLDGSVSIPAGGASAVSFPVPDLKDRSLLRLSAQVQASDPLQEDNRFYFVIRKPPRFPVMLSARGAAQLYLSEVIRSAGPLWELKVEDPGIESLKTTRVLVLHDPAAISERVASWVRDGGGLLIFSGPQSGDLKSPLLPVTARGNKILRPEREDALRLGDMERQHPIFQVFAEEQQHYLSTIHFYGYTAAEPAPEGQVLARFSSESPALAEMKYGSGRVLWFASSVSNDWNDFSIRPAFLPFVQQMITYLAGAGIPPTLFRAGERLDVSARTDSDAVAIDPAGERLALPADRPLLDLEKPGFYELRYNRLTDYAAVNVPASESNLEAEAVREVQARAGEARASAAEISAQALEQRQSWWRILLLVMGLLLVGEWFLADLYYGAVKASPARMQQPAVKAGDT